MRTKREKRIIRQFLISATIGILGLIGAIYIYLNYQPPLNTPKDYIDAPIQETTEERYT
jgi:hypothetical protein|tara:strand:- start:154 stop:330 length:177 start_codon:yes stop_codon:yes gene_type:complete